jgi:hypothetical protein
MISDVEGLARFGGRFFHGIEVLPCHPIVAPLLYSVPGQLIAYDVVVLKGTDVDQPRNLAKSVTVNTGPSRSERPILAARSRDWGGLNAHADARFCRH